MNKIQNAISDIVYYQEYEDFIMSIYQQLQSEERTLVCPLDVNEWGTDKHCLWMIFVSMFGDWGTSIRGGWIEDKRGCIEFLKPIIEDIESEEK